MTLFAQRVSIQLGDQHTRLLNLRNLRYDRRRRESVLAQVVYNDDRIDDPEFPAALRKKRRFKDPRFLGMGSFGGVWAVRARRLPFSASDRRALKYISFGELARETEKRRVRERLGVEISASRRLHGPHVLRVHEEGSTKSGLWYLMDLVEREDQPGGEVQLGRIVHEQQEWELGDSLTSLLIASQLAGVLADAGPKAIVHCDVKPDNILISRLRPQPHAFLADFGIAMILEDSPMTVMASGGSLGARQYRSPEQSRVRSDELTGFSDVYSLGRVLHFMLTGVTPPENGDLDMSLIRDIEKTSGIRELIDRTQIKEPPSDRLRARRFQNDCEELIQEIRTRRVPNRKVSILPEQPTAPKPDLKPERSERPAADPNAPTPRNKDPHKRPVKRVPRGDQPKGDRKPASLLKFGAASAALIGIVAAGGFFLGYDPEPEAAQARVMGKGLRVPYSEPWVTAGSQVNPLPGLRLSDPATAEYGPGSGMFMTVGRMIDPEPGGNPLSKATRATLEAGPAARSIEDSEGLFGHGERTELFLLPTSKGWYTISCSASAPLTGAFRQACRQAISGSKLGKTEATSLEPDPLTGGSVQSALNATGEAQSAARGKMHSESLEKRAEAAGTVASAFRDAASKIRSLKPRIQDQQALGKLAAGFASTGRAFSSLKEAAASEDEAAYAEARSQIEQGQRKTNRAVALLKNEGYRVRVVDPPAKGGS